jgi:hypothetical protein
MATDAFTKKVIELSSCVIAKTGTCARLTDGSTADAKRHRTTDLMKFLAEHGDKASLVWRGCHEGAPNPTVRSYRPLRSVKNDGGRSLIGRQIAILQSLGRFFT